MSHIAKRIAFAVGAGGLSCTLAIDFAGVVSRHLQHPINGTIELVRMSIALVVSAAILVATWSNAHAAVHVLLERLPSIWQARFARFGAAGAAIMLAGLCGGSAWLLFDTLGTDEKTYLLGIPLAPFRIVWCAATALAALTFVLRAVRTGPVEEPDNDS